MKNLKSDNMNRPHTVYVDLDSTLCDTRQRWHLINEEDRESTDWAAYSRACADDEPFAGPIALVRLLSDSGYRIVILSGRDESARADTEAWLHKQAVPFDEVWLRDETLAEHSGSNGEYKAKRIEADHGAIPVLMIDDWLPVKEALDAVGIPTLLVNPCYGSETSSESQEAKENRISHGSATTQTLA